MSRDRVLRNVGQPLGQSTAHLVVGIDIEAILAQLRQDACRRLDCYDVGAGTAMQEDDRIGAPLTDRVEF